MKITSRNDKNGKALINKTRITKQNCPGFQEVLDEIVIRVETEKFSTNEKAA